MAFRLTPTVFRREVQRRLMDTHAVRTHIGAADKSTVFAYVKKGLLPPPIVSGDRRFAFWDRDEVEASTPMRIVNPDTNGKEK